MSDLDHAAPALHAWWPATEPQLRADLVAAAETDAGLANRLLRYTAQKLNVRESWLRRQTGGWQARAVRLPALPESLASELAAHFLRERHRPMLAAFLDSLGIASNFGFLDHHPPPPEPERLGKAVHSLLERYPDGVVRLYLLALYWQSEAWAGLAPWLSAPPTSADAPVPAAAPAPEPTGGEQLSPLDKVLTLAIVASVQGIEGALSAEEMDDIVDEVVHLNLARHRSYFHLGHLHALRHQPLAATLAGGNPDRRLWYLTGAFVGYARECNWDAILAMLDAEDLLPLGQVCDARALQAGPHILAAMIERGQAARITSFFRPGVLLACGGVHQVFACARQLFQDQRLQEADKLLELVLLACGEGLPDTELETMALRLRAHCMQWRGDFSGARLHLQALLEDSSTHDRAGILTDLAMGRAGLRRLAEVEVPAVRESAAALRRNLEDIRELLLEAARAPGRQGHAHYCLGVLALLQEQHREAVLHLELALAEFQRGDRLYRAFQLEERCSFYLGVALLGDLDAARVSYALERIESGLRGGLRPPPALLLTAAEGLDAIDRQSGLQNLAELVAETLGEEALDSLVVPGRSMCLPVLKRIHRRALDGARPAQERMRDLLRVARAAPQVRGAAGLQAEALDGLQTLSRGLPHSAAADEFLDFLEDQKAAAYDPAWKNTDALAAAALLRECRGELDRAAGLLEALAQALLSQNVYGAEHEALDIAERIEAYGAGRDTTPIRSRLHAGSAQPPASPVRKTRPASIAVIGGDEGLAGMEEQIRTQVGKLDAAITLELIHTDWSSNGGEQFDRLRSSLATFDAIVVMRLIRTHLGRMLRAGHPRWIGCSGCSASSIVRAVLLAAERSREKAPARARARAAGR
ncbi:MAG: hypothetical protein ACRD04_08450 [Terriglobales bacterium]